MKNTSFKIAVFAIAAISWSALGCGSKGGSFTLLPTGQSFKQNSSKINPQMDILWVVDNSGSMLPLQSDLTSNFTSFITEFQNKGFNFQMAVTTTDAYLGDANFHNNPSKYWRYKDGNPSQTTGVYLITPTTPNLVNTFVINASQGDQGSGDERAFSSMKSALGYSANTGFLRQGDYMAVIILSDEDDFSGDNRVEDSWVYPSGIPDHDYNAATLDTMQSYVDYLDTFTNSVPSSRTYSVSAIAVLDNACLQSHIPSSPTAVIGQRYEQMVASVNSGLPSDVQGITSSICNNFAAPLAQIADNIISLSTQFTLTSVPVASTITVSVNGTAVPNAATNPLNNGGWEYDSTNNSIIFVGTPYIPPANATIEVNFTPASYGS